MVREVNSVPGLIQSVTVGRSPEDREGEATN